MRYSLTELCENKGEYGGGFSAVNYTPIAPRYIRITDITDDGRLKTAKKSPSGTPIEWEKYKLKDGDLLFARSGATVGKTFLYDSSYGNCIFAGYLIRFVPKKELVHPKFLYYYTKTPEYISWVAGKQNVVAQPNINAKQYGNELKIINPPLPVQQKIATILDTADALKQKDKALIAKYDELSQSLFLDMFGDPVINPHDLNKMSLKEVCIKITDGTHHSPPLQKTGIPYVTAKHIKLNYLDFFSKPTYVNDEDHNAIYKRCSPEFGDILYIKDGATTGIACINTFEEEISTLSSLALLKPNFNITNNYYLCYWLNHHGIKKQLIERYMSGAAIKRYTLKKINSFVCTVPPINLQNQFAERIQAIEQQKQQAQASLQKSEDLFNCLLQKAFKGELA